MKTLELNGLQELNQEELKNIDGGEIVNGYSDASARSAGAALTSFVSGLWQGFKGSIEHCNC